MGLLDSFERGLERAVNGAFARTFRSGLQPVEITAALRREQDTRAAPVARDRVLVPNRFTVRMNPADHERMAAMGAPLIEELTGLVDAHAREQGYQAAGATVIALAVDESLAVGMLQVDSASERIEVTWAPAIEIDGERHPIAERTVIGRGSDADVVIDDDGISRHHLEILWNGRRAEARDLKSTNGSRLNGERFTRAALANDSVLQIGRTRIVFRLLAQPGGTAR